MQDICVCSRVTQYCCVTGITEVHETEQLILIITSSKSYTHTKTLAEVIQEADYDSNAYINTSNVSEHQQQHLPFPPTLKMSKNAAFLFAVLLEVKESIYLLFLTGIANKGFD